LLVVREAAVVSCMASVAIRRVDVGVGSSRRQLQRSASWAVLLVQIRQPSLGVGWWYVFYVGLLMKVRCDNSDLRKFMREEDWLVQSGENGYRRVTHWGNG
jgi:hypothetical protein